MAVRADPRVELLLRIIDQAFDRKSWHGPNLRGSICRVTAADAAWRPHPDRHNIAEQVLHAAYWKYVVRRRLLGEKRGSFPLKGSNWFPVAGPLPESLWRDHVSLLEAQHTALRDAIAELTDARLPTKPPGSKVSNELIVTGIAAHDVYHAGQIQLIRAHLRAESPR